MSDLRLLSRGPMSPPDSVNVRVRPPDPTATTPVGYGRPSSPVSYRPSSRAMCIELPAPLQHSVRHLAISHEDEEDDDEEEHEPLRISFHEDEIRSQSLSRPASRKSLHDLHDDCILPPAGQFERPGTATEIDIEDPYPSLAMVRTSASGLLRFHDSDEDEDDRPAPCPPPMQERDSLSQCRLLPSPYPYWADDEDLQSPQQKDPFVGLQKQMQIMNRNLSGKLEELHGIPSVETHVALSEIRGQLHELTRSIESCQTDMCEVKRDMIAIKHEVDSVQMVKDEIDEIRDSLDKLEAESQRRKNKLLEQGLTFFLVYSIFSAVLGMLQFGYNTGVINAPEQVIEKFIRMAHRRRNEGENMTYEHSTFMYAIVVSIFAIGGMVGGFIGGWIANKFGRKGGLLINNIVGIAASLAMVFSKQITSYELLIVGRCLIGVNCGLNTSLVPMYISEIAPLNLRGGLGTINQLAVTVGLLTGQVLGVEPLLGTDDGWPYLLGIALFPSILQLILLPVCPESPRYLLITKGQEQAARDALKRLRNTPNIEDDIEEMRAEEMAQQAEARITMFELLRSPTLRMPLLIAIVMQLSQQLSGINAVFYYSTNLFITTGLSETSAKYATIGIGSVMVLMTLISIPLMDRSGRRTLHLYGLGGMFIFSIFITISFLVKELVSWIWWLSVVSTLFYVVFFAVGPGSIPWMITAELFSQGPRPAAMSVAVLINWCANFIVAIGFPTMQTMLENYTFLPFSCFLAIFWVFTYNKVPETKNKTFDEIATLFKIRNKQKNLQNVVNDFANLNSGGAGAPQQPQILMQEKKPLTQSPPPEGTMSNHRSPYHCSAESQISSPQSRSHSPRSRSPRTPRSRSPRSPRSPRSRSHSPCSAHSASPGSPQSQASEVSRQESCHSRQSRVSRVTGKTSRSRSVSPSTPRIGNNCISPPLYPRNYHFSGPDPPPRQFSGPEPPPRQYPPLPPTEVNRYSH